MSVLPSALKSPATGLIRSMHQLPGPESHSGAGDWTDPFPVDSHHVMLMWQEPPSSWNFTTSLRPSPLKSPASCGDPAGNVFGYVMIGVVGLNTPEPSASRVKFSSEIRLFPASCTTVTSALPSPLTSRSTPGGALPMFALNL